MSEVLMTGGLIVCTAIGVAVGFPWPLALGIAAFVQCLLANYQTGDLRFVRHAVGVALIAGFPYFILPILGEVLPFTHSVYDLLSGVVFVLAFLVATLTIHREKQEKEAC